MQRSVDAERAIVDVGDEYGVVDAQLGSLLEPDGLVDAAAGSVEDGLALGAPVLPRGRWLISSGAMTQHGFAHTHLLASRLREVLKAILDSHDDGQRLVLAGCLFLLDGDVGLEGHITAAVAGDMLTASPDVALVVDSAKVDEVVSASDLRCAHYCSVPEDLVVGSLANAAGFRLEGEGDSDLFALEGLLRGGQRTVVPLLLDATIFVVKGKVPRTVQGEPIRTRRVASRANPVWARVLWSRHCFGVDALHPCSRLVGSGC